MQAASYQLLAEYLRHFLHLIEFQFNWRRAPEDRDHHLQRLPVFVDLVHNAGEASKRSLGDAHRFVLFELDLELGLVSRLTHAIHDVLNFLFRKRRGLSPRRFRKRKFSTSCIAWVSRETSPSSRSSSKRTNRCASPRDRLLASPALW